MNDYPEEKFDIVVSGTSYQVIAIDDRFIISQGGKQIGVLQFWDGWRIVEGDITDDLLTAVGDAIDEHYD